MKNVKVLRLMSGQDVLAEIIGTTDTEYQLRNVLLLILSEQGMHAMPFMLFSDDKDIAISKTHVLCEANPKEEIVNSYIQKITGIQVASSPISPEQQIGPYPGLYTGQ